MTRYIWFERFMTDDLMATLAGIAEPIGPATPPPGDPISAIGPAHGALAGGLRYDSALMDRAPALLVIARTGIGYDNVDVAEATRRGIAVCNTPDGPTIPTAEHTFALLLATARKLRSIHDDMRLGRIQRDYHSKHNAFELNGATLGLVGIGRIGSRVARYARAFDMQVIAYDPNVSAPAAAAMGVELVASLEALLARADVVSLHLPLIAATRRLMNAERFAAMKPGALFVNAARGGLVDEAALIAALETGHLGGAGLDVTDPEPAPPDSPLLARDDIIVTPHVASATPAGKRRMNTRALEQVIDVLQGRRPQHLINTEVWPKVLERLAG